jgi:hypothetical protein
MKAGSNRAFSLVFIVLFGCLSGICLNGCSDERGADTKITISADSIIPEPIMIVMLADAHMIEAAMLIHRNRGLSATDSATWYYEGLYHKYGVSPNQYRQSIRFYQKDPKHFASMYQQVIQLLNSKENDFVRIKGDLMVKSSEKQLRWRKD